IAEGIRKLARAVAQAEGVKPEAWLEGQGLARYCEPSIKACPERSRGSSEAVDWDDEGSRRAFLTGLIADGHRLLELARGVRAELEPHSKPVCVRARTGKQDEAIVEASELLRVLLCQDVEPTDRGYRIRQGTAKDRIPSVHDPDRRHGHKSRGRSFTGHEAAIAVDVDSQLITAV